jgi:hypothetical protein
MTDNAQDDTSRADEAALIEAGISASVARLAEFTEEDGSPVAVCDPQCGVIAITEDEEGWHSAEWYVGWCSALTPRMGGRRYQYCPQCGSIVGYLPDARPFRIRHSRVLEALEQAQAERDRLQGLLSVAYHGLMVAQNRLSETLSQIPPHATAPQNCPHLRRIDTNEIAKHSGVGLAWCRVNHCWNLFRGGSFLICHPGDPCPGRGLPLPAAPNEEETTCP